MRSTGGQSAWVLCSQGWHQLGIESGGCQARWWLARGTRLMHQTYHTFRWIITSIRFRWMWWFTGSGTVALDEEAGWRWLPLPFRMKMVLLAERIYNRQNPDARQDQFHFWLISLFLVFDWVLYRFSSHHAKPREERVHPIIIIITGLSESCRSTGQVDCLFREGGHCFYSVFVRPCKLVVVNVLKWFIYFHITWIHSFAKVSWCMRWFPKRFPFLYSFSKIFTFCHFECVFVHKECYLSVLCILGASYPVTSIGVATPPSV